jgi:ribosome recycling factor
VADEDVQLVLDEANQSMDKAVRGLRAELQKVRTGRANPALLQDVQVDYYGAMTPLQQLANLTAPEPSLIVVSPFDKGALQAIERAIRSSDLGLTPNNDGRLIRIPIPPLTEERRKEIVRHLKKVSEEHKIGVRDARRAALSMLKELEADGGLPADDRVRADKKIQDLTDAHVKKIDEMAAQKEQEILQV